MKNKNFVFPVIAIFIFNSLIFAQSSQYPIKWYELTTNTNQTINFLNSYYAGCNNGTLLNWNWRFQRWDLKQLYTNDNLLCVYNDLIAGANGAIYKTTNFGANWTYQYFGLNENLNGAAGFHVTANNVTFYYLVTGAGKVCFSTTSPGSPFQVVYSSPKGLNSIAFNKSYGSVPFRGLAVGNNGTIINNVSDWHLSASPYTDNLNCVAYADTINAFIVGDNGLLIRTQDYGSTFTRINLNTTANLRTISFSTDNGRYFGIIGGDNGTCFISTNSGLNWTAENTSFNINFKSSYITGYSNLYYLAGENGKLLVRTYDSLYWYNYSFMPNNIKTTILNDGTFNNNNNLSSPGFQWPKDSNSYAVFTSGFNLIANVNNIRKMAGASYYGEYKPGYCINGSLNSDSRFKLYKVKKGESPQNFDYANWDKMVPYGAPYYDRNHNGTYDPDIDLPGVKGADETVFLCMTDADPNHHSNSLGFGGGTQPLFAEVHVTMWGYNTGKMKDVIFMKYEIINKSPQGNQYIWDSTYAGFFYDFDIGDGYSNFMGCDSIRNLAYGYCSNDSAAYYGKHPPAVGMNILRGLKINNIYKRTTSAIRIHHYNYDPIHCEIEPESNLTAAINVMRGFKNDGTKWVIPNTNPPQITKFTFSGDPETNTGWTPSLGRVSNCGDSLTGIILPEMPMDARFVMCTGDNNLKMYPGDTQIVYAAQLIARGYNNLNSVTRLKELNDSVQAYFDAGFPVCDSTIEFPSGYLLSQNYPNPFNASTKIKFYLPVADYVAIKVYDVTGREITKIINGYFNPGRYEITWDAKSYASGVYFYRFISSGLTEVKKMVLIK